MHNRAAGTILVLIFNFAMTDGSTVAGQPRVLESGFAITLETSQLANPTQLAFAPDGRLFMATRGGTIFAASYGPTGVSGTWNPVAVDVGHTLLGICVDSDGVLYASSNDGFDDTGFLARLIDSDGDGNFETTQRFVAGLPNAGHHNNQLGLADNLLYVGLGSRTDDGQLDDVVPVPAATILRIDLNVVDFESTLNMPEVYARGFRNAFGLTVDHLGRVWVGDNGQDDPIMPEKLHLVEPNAHHGFPPNLAPPGPIAPLSLLGFGTSANGLDITGALPAWGADFAFNLFIARFDYELNNPFGPGMDIMRLQFHEFDSASRPAVRAESVFATGFWHPLDVEIDPFGNLLILEYGSYFGPADGRIYRIAPLPRCPGDLDNSGSVDISDVSNLLSSFGANSNATHFMGDCDGDEDVDLSDLTVLLATFGAACD